MKHVKFFGIEYKKEVIDIFNVRGIIETADKKILVFNEKNTYEIIWETHNNRDIMSIDINHIDCESPYKMSKHFTVKGSELINIACGECKYRVAIDIDSKCIKLFDNNEQSLIDTIPLISTA